MVASQGMDHITPLSNTKCLEMPHTSDAEDGVSPVTLFTLFVADGTTNGCM